MEENEGIIYKTIKWTLDHVKLVVSLGFIFALFLFCLHLFNTYALVFIDADADFETENVAVYIGSDSTDETPEKAGETGSMLILPRSTKSVVVSSGENIKTRVNLEIPWYGIVDKKVSLYKDKNAEKIAYRSTTASTCALFRPNTDKLAYYNCQKPNAGLFEYQTPTSKPWSHKKVSSIIYPINYTGPGNHLGVLFSTPARVVGISDNNKSISYNAPDLGIEVHDTSEDEFADHHNVETVAVRIFSDHSNTKNKKFVIAKRSGEIFVGSPSSGSDVEYHSISAPNDYERLYNQTLCSVTVEAAYCYRGPTAIGDVPQGFNFDKVTQSQLVVHSFANKTTDIYKFSDNIFTLTDIHATDKGELYGYKFGQLYHFKKSGDTYKPVEVSSNVSSVAASDKLYYVNNDSVYAIDPDDNSVAHQVFYSSNVVPKALYPVDGNIFIIGTTPFDPNTTYAYRLLDQDNNGKIRPIDRFPFDTKKTSDIINNDLVGNRVYVALTTPLVRVSGGKNIDIEKYKQIKAQAEEYVQSRNVSGLTVQYSN